MEIRVKDAKGSGKKPRKKKMDEKMAVRVKATINKDTRVTIQMLARPLDITSGGVPGLIVVSLISGLIKITAPDLRCL